MVNSRFLLAVVSLLCFFQSSAQAQDNELKIAILVSGDQQTQVYNQLITQFETAYQQKVKLDFYSDLTFKKYMRSWIELGTYDLLYWQAGRRLKDLIDTQSIVPLSSIIDTQVIKQQYAQTILDAVTYDDEIYALPLGYYTWGFYYNKAIFNDLNLSPPRTWDEFLNLCAKLKSHGIPPLIQASADDWPVLAWLDYLALNTGGIDFRNLLTDGETDYAQMQTLNVRFDALFSQDFFFAPEHNWGPQQILPAILPNRAAMTLMGQFVDEQARKLGDEEIGFFPFPGPDVKSPHVEVAPMEVFVVPNSTNKTAKLRVLLDFIINYTALNSLGERLGWLPVTKQASSNIEPKGRREVSKRSVFNAASLVQYFDRDATEENSTRWAKAIIESMRQRDASAIKDIQAADSVKLNNAVKALPTNLLTFSTLKGKGTFMLSRILANVYQPLGYDITINRFDTSDAVLNSLDYGADGDLARVTQIPGLDDRALRVSEPLNQVRVFVVGKSGTCRQDTVLPENARLSYELDAQIFLSILDDLRPRYVQRIDPRKGWTALMSGETDYLLMFESELYPRRAELAELCFVSVRGIPSYHYLAKKHEKLTDKVAQSIKQFKATEQYRAIMREFGIGVLPNFKP